MLVDHRRWPAHAAAAASGRQEARTGAAARATHFSAQASPCTPVRYAAKYGAGPSCKRANVRVIEVGSAIPRRFR